MKTLYKLISFALLVLSTNAVLAQAPATPSNPNFTNPSDPNYGNPNSPNQDNHNNSDGNGATTPGISIPDNSAPENLPPPSINDSTATRDKNQKGNKPKGRR